MADESPTDDERREAVAAYVRDMHAYTFRLWSEARRQAEDMARIREGDARRQGAGDGDEKQAVGRGSTDSKTR